MVTNNFIHLHEIRLEGLLLCIMC